MFLRISIVVMIIGLLIIAAGVVALRIAKSYDSLAYAGLAGIGAVVAVIGCLLTIIAVCIRMLG